MYGQRAAPAAWTEHLANALKGMGFQKDVACPHLFFNSQADVLMEAHADDLPGAGPRKELEKFWAELTQRIRFKEWHIHSEYGCEYDHLKRVRQRTSQGIALKANKRYLVLEKALKGMETTGCNGVPTPMVAEVSEVDEEKDSLLEGERAKRYRSERAEGAKGVFRAEGKESVALLGWQSGSVQLLSCGWRSSLNQAVAWTDSNWAACKMTRQSSGGILMIGGCALFSYSRTQSVIADSSGMAEWYAIATASAETLFLQGVIERMMNVRVKFNVRTDSSAAKAVGQRIGAGKLRALEVKTLWCQSVLRKSLLTLSKCSGDENPADLATKAWTKNARKKVWQNTGLRGEVKMKGLSQDGMSSAA
eukprot:5562503-Amphidinium_carterae.1